MTERFFIMDCNPPYGIPENVINNIFITELDPLDSPNLRVDARALIENNCSLFPVQTDKKTIFGHRVEGRILWLMSDRLEESGKQQLVLVLSSPLTPTSKKTGPENEDNGTHTEIFLLNTQRITVITDSREKVHFMLFNIEIP